MHSILYRGQEETRGSMSNDLKDYLSQKGSVELICELGPHGARFKELDDALEISHQTIIDRLKDGQALSLIERELIEGERGTSHKYVLADKGRLLRVTMETSGVVESYYVLKESRKRFEENREEALELVNESADEIEEMAEKVPGMAPTKYIQLGSDEDDNQEE